VRDRSLVPIVAVALGLAAALGGALAAGLAFENSGKPAAERRKVVAIFKTPAATNAFWSSVRDGVESGAQDFDLEVSIRAPRDEMYVDEQIQIVEGAIAEAPAAIVLAAGDYHRLVVPVQKAKAAGIKVVCVDSFIESDDADTKVGTDNIEAGQKCGAALLKELSGRRIDSPSRGDAKPRVAMMSYVQGSSTAIGRETGLRAALGDSVNIAWTSYSSSEADRAYAQAKELLARESDLSGIAALNLPTLLGAARALSESGLKDRVALVGVDNSDEVMKYLERGVIRHAIVQKPFNMGYLSMRAVRELLDGRRPKAYTNTGSVDIDKLTMFEAENQKLLFPAPSK
jgi:ABC-type sugar transport system, periplasmic component